MKVPILSFLCTALSLCSGILAATYSNPLKDPNGSDPFIVYTNGNYYLLTSTCTYPPFSSPHPLTPPGTNIQITQSATLEGLKAATPTVVWTDTTPSRAGNIWAPEVHWIDDKWWLYYSAGTKTCCDGQRPFVLEGGADVLDAYTFAGQLTEEWGIDGTVLRTDNANYFVWSRISEDSLQSLYIAEMESPTTLAGTHYLLSKPTEEWETVGNPVNEGPAALYHGGVTYLTYSASYCWTTSYQLGLLTWNGVDDILQASSWTKSGPVFSSANGNLGTGHNGFFSSPDGTEIWNVYHATDITTGSCDGKRYTMAQIVNWNSDGTPDFGTAAALGTELEGPSGEA